MGSDLYVLFALLGTVGLIGLMAASQLTGLHHDKIGHYTFAYWLCSIDINLVGTGLHGW